jgi:hypothetical protein
MIAQLWRTVCVVSLVGLTSTAIACGFCVEDKIAVVYDHAVVMRALERKHHIAFFALEGVAGDQQSARRSYEMIAEATFGVDKDSARVSLESASLSLSFDPTRTSVANVERMLSRKMASRGVSIAILRVMDKPAEIKAVTQR